MLVVEMPIHVSVLPCHRMNFFNKSYQTFSFGSNKPTNVPTVNLDVATFGISMGIYNLQQVCERKS